MGVEGRAVEGGEGGGGRSAYLSPQRMFSIAPNLQGFCRFCYDFAGANSKIVFLLNPPPTKMHEYVECSMTEMLFHSSNRFPQLRTWAHPDSQGRSQIFSSPSQQLPSPPPPPPTFTTHTAIAAMRSAIILALGLVASADAAAEVHLVSREVLLPIYLWVISSRCYRPSIQLTPHL